jgi:hypothetical protein
LCGKLKCRHWERWMKVALVTSFQREYSFCSCARWLLRKCCDKLLCMIARASVRACLSGRSAAWLARLVRDQEVDGSNPFAPTIISPLDSILYAAFSTSGFASFLRAIRATSAILGGSAKPKPTVFACSKRNATSSFILL